MADDQSGPHAFICYVREDHDEVDDLASMLKDAGIKVWRDTEDLWPGMDWKDKIRDAITKDAFAFIACFSEVGVAKEVSGQYPELVLAAEEHRKRRPGVPWIIPVRFDDCAVPNMDLGASKTLGDIQWADLFGPNKQRNIDRLIGSVQVILQGSGAPSPVEHVVGSDAGAATDAAQSVVADPTGASIEQKLKGALRDPGGDIIVHDLIMPIADRVRDQLNDMETFPIQGPGDVAQIAGMIRRQWDVLDELLDAFIVAGLWSTPEHDRTWTEAAQRVASTVAEQSGLVRLIEARIFPLLPMVYATGVAAVYRQNYSVLRAVAVDATVRDHRGRIPVVARSNPWQPFSEYTMPAQVLALEAAGEVVEDDVIRALETGQRGKRYTPGSDLLHDRLRPRFAGVIIDDDQFSETFDRLEVVLALLTADAKIRAPDNGPWIGSPTAGRFTWRERYAEEGQTVDRRMLAELVDQGEAWPPLRAGMFGGSVARANAAFDLYLPYADKARSSRW